MLAHELRPLSAGLADRFEHVATPPTLGPPETSIRGAGPAPDLGPDPRVVILVGPGAASVAESVHTLARHLGAPVANTWGIKGIYAWDDPHHMGTCGLQRDDFDLLGFADFDVLVTIGLDPAESPAERLLMIRRVALAPDASAITALIQASRPRIFHPAPNELYARIAAIAQPGYLDESVPRHPARAVADLKQSLGPDDRVVAQPGRAGLWIARTFPTDRLGRVIVPAHDEAGIGAAIALVSAAAGTPTVYVSSDPPDALDDVTAEVLEIATVRALPVHIRHWGDEIDWSRTEDLVAAAGPVVAWTS